MENNKLTPGKNVPYEINVVIEIPAYSPPVKYEVDKDTGALFVNRFMATAMRYPCNYGYIPGTLADDGDPLDVVVISPFSLFNGVVIRSRPIGLLKMQDESGEDSKVIAVPHSDLTDLYSDVKTHEDLPRSQLYTIRHFFEHYKDLEPGKWVEVDGWVGLEDTYKEINDSLVK
ncbi:MAG: inorganic diphosphatase [Gammaproteobacteria bacterium]|nr:inorganic diphosphatase [Gammaproteobacteria bacterium]